MITIGIPENLMILIHAHVAAAHTLAIAASRQHPSLKNKPPKELMAVTVNEALRTVAAMPDEQRQRVLMRTAEMLGKITQADSVTIEREKGHPQN